MRHCGPVLALLGVSALVSSQAAPLPLAAPAAGPLPQSASTRAPAAPVRADPVPAAPLYRVELIVFRTTVALGSPENWAAESSAAGFSPTVQPAGSVPTDSNNPSSGGTPAGGDNSPGSAAPATGANTPSGGSAPATPSAAQRAHLDLLPPTDFALDWIAARLRGSGRYALVAHAAWTQLASPWGRPIEIPVASLGLDAPGLGGAVALERGEFLHLAVRLDYTESDPPPGLDAAPGTVFVLDQVHRVRFNERNYFDHPAFGVIALVTPVKASRGPPP